jgi:hypothetical protein
MTRKDRIERLAERGQAWEQPHAAQLWYELMRNLLELTTPDTRGPRFDDILVALERAAGVRHDREVGTMVFSK